MNHTFPSIEHVMSLTPEGMREGRDNVLKFMEILGNPQDTLQVFHITGSNGKGSVCQMISQVLWKKFKKKVGLFTSPHFIRINERFQINGISIADDRLETYYKKVLDLSEDHRIPLSFFEIQVVVMVLYFVDEKVDYAVVEVGLGGLYDGTNIFTHPLACFITSIALEHTHVLGKTKQSILRNKLGIVKPGTNLYTWIQTKQVYAYCEKNKIRNRMRGLSGKKKNVPLTNLLGAHQEKNALLVLKALQDIGCDEKNIKTGLKHIYNPGRFEWISPTILVDTANNIQNIRILSKMVAELRIPEKVTIIFGTTQTDPAYAATLANMVSADKRILVDDFCDRSLPCSEYAPLVKHDREIHFFHEKEKIEEILRDPINIKIVYGSFYLVGEILKLSIHKPFA